MIQQHDWIAIMLAVMSAIVVPAVGIAYLSKMKQIEAEFQKSIIDMEDRVIAFIRKHEQDGFAHPNLEAIRLITTKLDLIATSLHELTLMIREHIASHSGGK